MGNNSLLTVREHIAKLICSIDKIEDSEHLHTLCHALETIVQCEQSNQTIDRFRTVIGDFPSDIDFD